MSSNPGPDKTAKMSQEERDKLAKKLDDDLDAYISNLETSASKFQVVIDCKLAKLLPNSEGIRSYFWTFSLDYSKETSNFRNCY